MEDFVKITFYMSNPAEQLVFTHEGLGVQVMFQLQLIRISYSLGSNAGYKMTQLCRLLLMEKNDWTVLVFNNTTC